MRFPIEQWTPPQYKGCLNNSLLTCYKNMQCHTGRRPESKLSKKFPHQNSACIPCLFLSCHMPTPSQPPWIHYCNNTGHLE